jgi:hypothetical protein
VLSRWQIVGVGKNYKAHVAELAAGDNPLVRRRRRHSHSRALDCTRACAHMLGTHPCTPRWGLTVQWKNDPDALKEPLLFIKPTSSCACTATRYHRHPPVAPT